MRARTLVVTGANGFVGSHLAELAHAEGHRVWGMGRESEPNATLAPFVEEYFPGDLRTSWDAPAEVDAVVHLAGLAAIGASFEQPQRYLDVNGAIMTRMSETLLSQQSRPRVVVVSSGSVYATKTNGGPVSEQDPIAPTSPYAVAKILVETQAAYYVRRGLDMVIARPFNHIGPGQGPGFLIPDLAMSMCRLSDGEELGVGNLEAARDYSDVRDVARAYLALALGKDHRHTIYNVASGVSHTGREILAVVAEALGRNVPPLRVDHERLRPSDPLTVVGDATRLRQEFGWHPQFDWRESVRDYVRASGASGE